MAVPLENGTATFWSSNLLLAKVTERFRRIDYGHLEIEVTVDDPKCKTDSLPHADIQNF